MVRAGVEWEMFGSKFFSREQCGKKIRLSSRLLSTQKLRRRQDLVPVMRVGQRIYAQGRDRGERRGARFFLLQQQQQLFF